MRATAIDRDALDARVGADGGGAERLHQPAELFVDELLNIAGACRGQSADGLSWTCDVGQRAVDEAILSADLLGQYSPGPRSG